MVNHTDEAEEEKYLKNWGETLKKTLKKINNNNKLQFGCHPVAVVTLHV